MLKYRGNMVYKYKTKQKRKPNRHCLSSRHNENEMRRNNHIPSWHNENETRENQNGGKGMDNTRSCWFARKVGVTSLEKLSAAW